MFLFHAPPPSELYTLSLHDALPICPWLVGRSSQALVEPRLPSNGFLKVVGSRFAMWVASMVAATHIANRSEEHTSELQSRLHLVCRLLLEKKKRTGVPCAQAPRYLL